MHLYYLRPRWMNPLTGRFMSRDPNAGNLIDPKTLHKYLYAGGDPVDLADPTGRASALENALIIAVVVEVTVPKYAPLLCAAIEAVESGYTLRDLGKSELNGEIPGGPELRDIFFDLTGLFCKTLFVPGMD